MSGFQKQVNLQQAPAVAGDFASADPWATYLAGEGALVAGAAGVTQGCFAWVLAGVALNTGTGAPQGFVHRDGMGLITSWPAMEASMIITQGREVSLMTRGAFWAVCTVAAATGPGVQKAFAKLTDGTVQPGAAGATIAGYVETPFYIGSLAAVGELVKITTWMP